jgi:putative DNA primase/helicase
MNLCPLPDEMMKVAKPSPVQKAASSYVARGWSPLPIHERQKRPKSKNWQTLRLQAGDIDQYFLGDSNVGLLLGSASGGLVDIDLDAFEAVKIAGYFLPETGLIHGRPNKRSSHRWYVCDPPPKYHRFSDLDGTCLVELRSDGHQTIVPPSIHPNGEELCWERHGEPAPVDSRNLTRAVLLVASGSLLARHWPVQGSRHYLALALHGWLLRSGWSVGETSKLVSAAARIAGDEEWKLRGEDADSTFQKLKSNQKTTGLPSLSQILDTAVLGLLSDWLHLNRHIYLDEREFAFTDLGNSKRFTAEYGQDLKYCHALKTWFVWDGCKWTTNERGEVKRLAMATVVGMLSSASIESDYEKRKEMVAWQRQSESESRLKSLIALSESEIHISIGLNEFDCDPYLFNCANGTIELNSGHFREHRRTDLITKISPVSFDPNAQCPTWLGFLDTLSGGNEQLVSFLQSAAGYSLTGDTTEQVLFMLYGSGANGKTTYLEALRHILGDYAMCADFSSFISAGSRGIRNDLARLHGSRMVTAVESQVNRYLDEEVIKQITGRDVISARRL